LHPIGTCGMFSTASSWLPIQKQTTTSIISIASRSLSLSSLPQQQNLIRSSANPIFTCATSTTKNTASTFSTRVARHTIREGGHRQTSRPNNYLKTLQLRFIPPSISDKMLSKETSKSNETNNEITDIEEIHRNAILNKQSTYIDPNTGFTAFTELAHLKRGKCCGNMCRHCPYGWSNVKGSAGTGSANAKVKSGDKEGTSRLVKKIFDGTYYDDSDAMSCGNDDMKNIGRDVTEEKMECHTTYSDAEEIFAESRSRGKGGYAGGTLTTKNVPYTRKGDSGTSALFTGERREKNDAVFEALGTVDELSCVVGVAYAELISPRSDAISHSDGNATTSKFGDLPEQLLEVMSRLLDVGSHIARPKKITEENCDDYQIKSNNDGGFSSYHTALLEDWIDNMTEQLPELTSFILPTGTPASAQFHVARTVCRRAERRMVPLVQNEGSLDPETLSYVNRLSDYLFTAARFVNYCEGKDELQYRREQMEAIERGKNEDISMRKRVVVKLNEEQRK